MATSIHVTAEELAMKLKAVFCSENKKEKRYAEVWLSDELPDLLHHTDRVAINIKMLFNIESRSEEIKRFAHALFGQLAKEELKIIRRIHVYNATEEVYCESDDLLVYRNGDICG